MARRHRVHQTLAGSWVDVVDELVRLALLERSELLGQRAQMPIGVAEFQAGALKRIGALASMHAVILAGSQL